ncbi:MAG: GGDEF domain-containing protein [Firmicutes bacterium]|nr:GGDEF domain-containing protein [Bacillota bacterium]
MGSIMKRVVAVLLRLALLVLALVGLTYVSATFTVSLQYLTYILYGALLIISISFRKQKAVLLLSLFLALTLPLDFPVHGAELDPSIISSGVVILLAVNTLLLGLFEEGQIRLGAFLSLIMLTAVQALAVFSLAYHVGRGSIAIVDRVVSLEFVPFQLGALPREVSFVLLICLAGSLLKELLVPTPFASLAVNLLLSLGVFHYLEASMGLSLHVLFLVWGLLTAFYVFQRIYQVSYVDSLTGIPSRRALHEEASALTGNYVVAMADIDFFKKFNDKYGHDVGDDVLAFVASTLNRHAHGSVFRYGGEEFVLLFRKTSLDETLKHLDELRQHVASSKFKIRRRTSTGKGGTSEVTITISIGVAEHSDRNTAFSEVLKAADKALYRAKKKGRNCVSK